jgi:hypothetical protein
MKPVDQTKFGKPDGNCFAACIASVLEFPLESLPDLSTYADDDGAWWLAIQAWIEENTDYSYVEVAIQDFEESNKFFGNSYWIATGKSPRGKDLNHAVVYCQGELVHDPHPDKTGLKGNPTVAGFFTLGRKDG